LPPSLIKEKKSHNNSLNKNYQKDLCGLLSCHYKTQLLGPRGDPNLSLTFNDLENNSWWHGFVVEDPSVSLFSNSSTHKHSKGSHSLSVWIRLAWHHSPPMSNREVCRSILSSNRRDTEPLLHHSQSFEEMRMREYVCRRLLSLFTKRTKTIIISSSFPKTIRCP
jgi:hypothetical protein